MHEVQRPPMRPQRYESPSTLPDALDLLALHADRARVVAGGTDLMVELDRRLGPDVDVLIDISRIQGLDHITLGADRLQLGPLATHNQCATSADVAAHALPLSQACREVGSPALRNRATVAGNLVTASPANDTISALLALEASVTLSSARRQRTLPLDEFFLGPRQTVLAPDELVTAIDVPILPSGARAVFVKHGLRRAQAIAVVHAAAVVVLDGDLVREARIALGSVAPTVVRAVHAENALTGQSLTRESIAEAARLAGRLVTPISDHRGSARYRRQMVQVMVRRALASLSTAGDRLEHEEQFPTLGGPSVVPDGAGGHLRRGETMLTTVNGTSIERPWNGETLLDWVRDEVGLTGTKESCNEGECGACTVYLDGVAVLSCLVPAARASRASVVTVEGANGPHQRAVQDAFVDGTAVQCGYCTPGFVMAAAALLEECRSPSRSQVQLGLSGNLCRCTGYYGIESAVHAAGMDQ